MVGDSKATRNGERSFVVVTGMSGAGKSTALDALEDAGFEVVDNLPLSLFARLCQPTTGHAPSPRLAVGVDARSRGFSAEALLEVLAQVRDADIDTRVIFLDCDRQELVQRFSTTRRKHPLAQDRPVLDGIRAEFVLMGKLKEHADFCLDTTNLKPQELKSRVQEFASNSPNQMHVTVQSFAYGNGLPRQADIVWDVRFLRNPHYVESLRPGTGEDEPVASYVKADEDYAPYMDAMKAQVIRLLPRYQAEGKSYLTIAFGCTGGRHRSVTSAEDMAAWLRQQKIAVTLFHRELS